MTETKDQLLQQIEELKRKLQEAEETLEAIRSGEVDALVVSGSAGDQVFTLKGADETYRTIVETMSEGSAVIDEDGTILYANGQLSTLLQVPLSRLIGSPFSELVRQVDARLLNSFLKGPSQKAEFVLAGDGDRIVPVLLSASPLVTDGTVATCLVITDLTERKRAEYELQRAHDDLEVKVDQRTRELKDSEERYRSLYETSLDGIMVTIPDGTVLSANRRMCEMLGMTEEEILAAGREGLVVHDEKFAAALDERARTGKFRGELTYRRKDGSVFAVEAMNTVFQDAAGRTRTSHTIRDITDRKRAEEEIRKALETARSNEAQLRVLMQNVGSAVALVDQTGTFSIVNRAFLEMFGLNAESDILNVNSQDWSRWEVYGEDSKLLDVDGHPVRKAVLTGKAVTSQLVAVQNPGAQGLTWMLVNAEPLLREDGSVHMVICTYHDITERKVAEENILAQSMLMRGINRILHEAISSDTEEELGLVCLSVAQGLTGSKIGFIGEIRGDGQLYDIFISNPGWDLCSMHDQTGHRRPPGAFKIHGLYGHVLEHGSLLTNDPSAHPDSIGLPEGHPPLTAFLGAPLIDVGKTIGLVAVGNREGGYSVRDQELLEALAPAIVQALLRKRAEDQVRTSRDELELRVQERTAELQLAYDRLKEETAEREQVEAQLRQAQKMEALGVLTGGIAHDFNNILAAVIGFTEIAKDKIPRDSKVQHQLDRVLTAGMRGRELVRHMLTFSRKGEQEKKPLPLSGIVKETAKLLRASIPATITIKTDVRSDSGYVFADPTQMQQIVMNLCTNAAHAMREKGGVLHIELSDFSVSATNGDPHDIKPGHYMKLTVRDNGSGIPPEIVDKIFDPFFTTKEPGEGTGLGLSVVHGIVRQHAGYVTVESTPRKGSTFTVYLPKIAGETPEETATDDAVPAGHERVLFVDDEDPLTEMGRDILEELGYSVTVKKSSIDALLAVKKDPSAFDLIITDQTMPEMTGLDLAREVLALRPDMPIILCTGFSHLVDADRAAEAGIKAFAMKPLTKREIARTIRKVLDE